MDAHGTGFYRLGQAQASQSVAGYRVVEAAREFGINLSQTCEAALRAAAKAERERRWQEENKETIEAWNAWVEEHGLPLAKYRQF